MKGYKNWPSFAKKNTRSLADADKPARLIWRSIKVTKRGTIRYVRYGCLLVWYSNFVRKTQRFEIYDFKDAVILKTGSGVPGRMGGAAGTAGTAAAVPLLREVRQDKVLPYHILVKKSQTYR